MCVCVCMCLCVWGVDVKCVCRRGRQVSVCGKGRQLCVGGGASKCELLLYVITDRVVKWSR